MADRKKLAGLPRVEIRSRREWRAWLAKHHRRSDGVWVVTFKKSSGKPYVGYDDIVDEALAFGWIDSLPRSLDAERSMRLVSPRKPTSAWSQRNKERVAGLVAAGRMAKSGLAAIEAAKQRGTWGKLDGVERLTLPRDLVRALDGAPPARVRFDAFPRSVKRAILEWIGNARREETRAARVAETARLAAKNVRANQWRQPKTGLRQRT